MKSVGCRRGRTAIRDPSSSQSGRQRDALSKSLLSVQDIVTSRGRTVFREVSKALSNCSSCGLALVLCPHSSC